MPPKGKKGKGGKQGKNAGKSKDGKKNGKTNKRSPKKEVEEPESPKTLYKLSSTWEDFPPFYFSKYRCNECKIVFNGFIQFIAHSCWRKFFLAKFDLAETQVYICRHCYRLYRDESDYASHECGRLEPEDVLPVTPQDHFDFFKLWRRRMIRETTPHEPDTFYLIRCGTCGRRYKTKLEYLVHSCIAVHGLAITNIRNLTVCEHCKLVFGTHQQFNEHVQSLCNPRKAYQTPFETNRIDRACQQFILMRHRTEEQLEDEHPLMNCPNICFYCGYEYPSILEYLQHPCVAGETITPFDLELTLLCRLCHRIFTDINICKKHINSCPTNGFYFLRFGQKEISLALERFSEDDTSNVHHDKRPRKFLCRICHEIFRNLQPFLKHACPTPYGKKRFFLQPSSLLEMYVCSGCNLVCLNALEAQLHTDKCPLSKEPSMIWLHLTREEYLTALEPWCQKPRVLELPMSLSTELAQHESNI